LEYDVERSTFSDSKVERYVLFPVRSIEDEQGLTRDYSAGTIETEGPTGRGRRRIEEIGRRMDPRHHIRRDIAGSPEGFPEIHGSCDQDGQHQNPAGQ